MLEIENKNPIFVAGGVRGNGITTNMNCKIYGGDTTSIFIKNTTGVLIIDAGTGINNYQNILKNTNKITLFFTHAHFDHINGIQQFLPFYDSNFSIKIYATDSVRNTIETIFSPPIFPVNIRECAAKITWYKLNPEKINSFETQNFSCSAIPISHPNNCFAYFIKDLDSQKSLLFATDIEIDHQVDFKKQNNLSSLLKHLENKNPNVLIIDAMLTPSNVEKFRGYGHTDYQTATKFGEFIKANKTFLTHHAQNSTDQTIERHTFNIENREAIFLKQNIIYNW